MTHKCFSAFLSLLTVLVASNVFAASPMQKNQAPGYYRMMLGQFEVTALHDGMLDIDASLLRGISEPDIQKLLTRAFIDDLHKIPTSTNVYLINTGTKLILVDTGGGKTFTPTLGKLCENLKAAGYAPEQIDFVLMTHLHPDHVGGLTDAEGQTVFPKAVVYVAKAEHDYWFSDVEPQNVPATFKEHLKNYRKLVRNIAKPYLALNQWKTFENADLPIDGVKAHPVHGHTPGHTAYEITSGGQSLVILGDTLHCAAVQFPRPAPTVTFDVDGKQAAASRKTLFDRLADSKTFVAGMHIPFPGIGHLRSDGNNAYTWTPVEYSSLPTTQSAK